MLGKKLGEIVLISESEFGRYFGDEQVRRVKKQLFCARKFIFVYITYRCCAEIVFEIADKLLL